jgi:transposase
LILSATEAVMMGRQTGDQSQLFYLFNLEERVPTSHLLRRSNPVVTRVLAKLRENLEPFYSDIGRPSIDPELMIRMLIVGYCYGIRSERRLCEEVEMHLAYRWFCRLDLDDRVPDHSTFSVNRHGRFRSSNIFRQLFEAVVRACMDAGLLQGEGFAVDASVIEANASRYAVTSYDVETRNKKARSPLDRIKAACNLGHQRIVKLLRLRRYAFAVNAVTRWIIVWGD